MKRLALSLAATLALTTAVRADTSDLLIIDNSEPGVVQRLVRGDLTAVQAAFEARGAEVGLTRAADADTMRDAFRVFVDGLDAGTDDVGIMLTGQFVSTVVGGYLLPAGMDQPTMVQALTEGFPLDAVYALAAQYPGRALVILGEVETEADLPAGLSVTLSSADIPQGVTVAIGPASNAARFVDQLSNAPGQDVLPIAREAGLSLLGFVPRQLPMFAATEAPLPQITVDTPPDDRSAEDAAAWQSALSADTEDSYDRYLAAFPQGENASEARQRLAAIRAEPFYREKQAEEGLALSRDARREIQRDLSLLGYNTRGIDGIFGRGTRGAVTAWQTANGLPASGYVNADQIARLDAQAERRAAELEEEARQRQAELERQDRTFWSETGARGDEVGFRAYLKRFPDGIYADEAQARLDAIEDQRREQAEGEDRRRWQVARDTDTEAGYRAYLAERPDGAFVEEARARIDYFLNNSEQIALQERAQAEEAALGLNEAARRLAEARLADLGLQPGAVDGTFDEDARRAIRRYQDARKLRVSGYLDQATVVRLMADTILR